MDLFSKEVNHIPKAIRIAICYLIWFVIWATCVHEHATAVPITNRICALRDMFVPTALIDPCMASACISKVYTHESRSDRACISQVLRIRLSRWNTIQNALFFCILKAWFERALCSQRVKAGFQIRKGSESWSETAFGTRFVPLWTGPMIFFYGMLLIFLL